MRHLFLQIWFPPTEGDVYPREVRVENSSVCFIGISARVVHKDVPVIFKVAGAFQACTLPPSQTRGPQAGEKPMFTSQPLKELFKEWGWGGGQQL